MKAETVISRLKTLINSNDGSLNWNVKMCNDDIVALNFAIECITKSNEMQYINNKPRPETCSNCNTKLNYSNDKNLSTQLSADMIGNIFNYYFIKCEKCNNKEIFYKDKWVKVS